MNLSQIDLTNIIHDVFDIDFIENFPTEIRLHKTVMHILSSLSIVVNSLAVYIILGYSPPQIGTYKLYLLNIVVKEKMLSCASFN